MTFLANTHFGTTAVLPRSKAEPVLRKILESIPTGTGFMTEEFVQLVGSYLGATQPGAKIPQSTCYNFLYTKANDTKDLVRITLDLREGTTTAFSRAVGLLVTPLPELQSKKAEAAEPTDQAVTVRESVIKDLNLRIIGMMTALGILPEPENLINPVAACEKFMATFSQISSDTQSSEDPKASEDSEMLAEIIRMLSLDLAAPVTTAATLAAAIDRNDRFLLELAGHLDGGDLIEKVKGLKSDVVCLNDLTSQLVTILGPSAPGSSIVEQVRELKHQVDVASAAVKASYAELLIAAGIPTAGHLLRDHVALKEWIGAKASQVEIPSTANDLPLSSLFKTQSGEVVGRLYGECPVLDGLEKTNEALRSENAALRHRVMRHLDPEVAKKDPFPGGNPLNTALRLVSERLGRKYPFPNTSRSAEASIAILNSIKGQKDIEFKATGYDFALLRLPVGTTDNHNGADPMDPIELVTKDVLVIAAWNHGGHPLELPTEMVHPPFVICPQLYEPDTNSASNF